MDGYLKRDGNFFVGLTKDEILKDLSHGEGNLFLVASDGFPGVRLVSKETGGHIFVEDIGAFAQPILLALAEIVREEADA